MDEKFYLDLQDNLCGWKSTFKDVSWDKNDRISLCEDESILVYNFDKVAGDFFKSADAMIIKNKVIILIEFKNSSPIYQCKSKKDKTKYVVDDNKTSNIRNRVNLKMYDSLLVFGEYLQKIGLINKARDVVDLDIRYFFVYSKLKEDLRDKDLLARCRNSSGNYYDLDRYVGKVVKKVLTIDNETFNKKIVPKL